MGDSKGRLSIVRRAVGSFAEDIGISPITRAGSIAVYDTLQRCLAYVRSKDAEIVKLRSERDEARKIIESSFDQANRIALMVSMSQWPRNQAPSLSNFLSTIADMTSVAVRALAAARAALDGERGRALTEAADAMPDRPALDAHAWPSGPFYRQWLRLRAAEAKASRGRDSAAQEPEL